MRPAALLVVLGLSACADTPAEEPSDASTDTASLGETSVSDTAVSEAIPSDTAPVPGDPKTVPHPFVEDDATFLNPERGWMDGGGIALTDTTSYTSIRTGGFTLAYAKVRLDAYRTTTALPKSFLDALDAGLARVRAAGIKVVLRFVYNDGTGGDASEATVLGHIAQVGPIVTKNADVVAVWQAGFIGLWGEWHSSTNGLETPASRKKIVDALLAALPADRMIQLRTPHFKAELWKDPTPESLWFSGDKQARVGHHNDCFLASASDEGTYLDPIAAEKTWLESDIRALPMGGESCAKTTLTTCDNAKKELARFRWSFYNPYWHPDVYAQWGAEGCRDEIGKRLGYRLVLDEASWPNGIAPGGVLPLSLKIRNVGFAPMFNPRPVRIVLADGKTRWVATWKVDPRRWMPGTTSTASVRLRVPASAATGNAKVELWLPDATLGARTEYAVRLASKGVWDATLGTNVLTDALPIDPAVGGAVDPTAKELSVLE